MLDLVNYLSDSEEDLYSYTVNDESSNSTDELTSWFTNPLPGVGDRITPIDCLFKH